MIEPLRRRHRWMLTTLAVALPVGVALALTARPPVAEGPLPAPLTAGSPETGAPARDILRAGPVELAVAHLDNRIEVRATTPPSVPEPLVYWTPDVVIEGTRGLPGDAVFIGPLSMRRLLSAPAPAPDATSAARGALTVYSLGHGEVVGSVPLPATSAPPGGRPGDAPSQGESR
ncbi:MAG: hypothetical protein AAGN46_03395 [Acidobacteriota bacterium]